MNTEELKKGLSSKEAKLRLSEDGYNELPSAKPKNLYRIALEVFQEPMFLLLIGCGVHVAWRL
jgi:Ca2+-transporting ATPase